MAWWPLGRHRREPGADAASPRPAPPPSGPAGSDGAWRDVPVLQPVLAEPLRPVAIGNNDADWLAAHANPSFLAPLSHQVQPWTGGLVEGLLAPGRPVPHGSGAPLEVHRRTRPRPGHVLQRSLAVSAPEPTSGRVARAELESPEEASWDGEGASAELTTVRLELPPRGEGPSAISDAGVVTSAPQVPEVTVPRPPVRSGPVPVAPEQPRPAPRAAPSDARPGSVGGVGSTADPLLPPPTPTVTTPSAVDTPPSPTDTPPLPVVSRLAQAPTLGHDPVSPPSAPPPPTRSPSTRRSGADADSVPVPPPVQRLHVEPPTATRNTANRNASNWNAPSSSAPNWNAPSSSAPTTAADRVSTVSAAARSSSTTGPAPTHPPSPVQSSPVFSEPVYRETVPLQRSVAPEIPGAAAPADPPRVPRPAAVPLPVVTPEAWSAERAVATPPLPTTPATFHPSMPRRATEPGVSILVQRRAERPADPAAIPPDPASPPERRSFTHMFADLDSSVPTAELRTGGGQLQRQTSEEPVAAAPSIDSEPVSSAPSTPAPASPAPSSPAPSSVDLEEMARRLYEPLSARLRTELWLDRERAGLIGDA